LCIWREGVCFCGTYLLEIEFSFCHEIFVKEYDTFINNEESGIQWKLLERRLMIQQEFKSMWESKFPEAYPIGHELKWVYEDRWFRIHSLPNSKRYAETEEEYEIIYKRQNEIISDLVGENEEVILLFGQYANNLIDSDYDEIFEFSLFQKVDTLELHKLRPKQYEVEFCLDIYARKTTWESNQRNDMLKAIADDEIRVLIIVPHKNRIIYPYDGGVDLILESEKVRDVYKDKYKMWLSSHPQGL